MRPIAATYVLASLLAFAGLAGAAFAQVPAPAKPLDRLGQAMAKAGIKRCAPIMRRVAEFLIEDGDAGFRLKSTGADKDTAPAVLTLETRHKTFGTVRYATVVVVPQSNCSGYYEQSIFWPMACPDLKANNFANFPAAAFLHSAIAVSEASESVQLAMLPAGTGCVSIKKEIFR